MQFPELFSNQSVEPTLQDTSQNKFNRSELVAFWGCVLNGPAFNNKYLYISEKL